MGEPVEYDPFSSSTLADPAAAHQLLRDGCPVHRYDRFDPPFFTYARYEDVADGLRDVRTYSSRWGQGPHFTTNGGLFNDPPVHTVYRRLVQQAFTPRAVAQLEPFVTDLAHRLVDGFVDRGEADLHDEIAYPLPVIVIAQMLGVPSEDRERFKHWSDALVAGLGSQDRDAHKHVRAEAEAYLVEHIREREALLERGAELPDDLVGRLVAASYEGRRLTTREMLGMLVQLLVGGNETTTSLLTNALLRLCERPQLLERLRASGDWALYDVAVEESLRFDPPVLGLFRSTTCPVQRHGVEIPEGSKVMMMYAAANRDGEAFEDPDEFSLDRDLAELRRKHLAFGLGVHFCLGAPLARLEGRIALRAIVERLPGLRMTGEPERIAPFLLWGRRTFPAAWDVT